MKMMSKPPTIDEGTSASAKKKKRERRRSDFIPEKVKIIDLESIADKGNTKEDAISVEGYSEQRDHSRNNNNNHIDLDNYDDELFVLNFVPSPNSPHSRKKNHRRKTNKPFIDLSINIERGESSNSKPHPYQGEEEKEEEEEEGLISSFICEICVEPKQANESFNIKGCSHSYCTDCILKYVGSKLQDKISAINCPVANCKGLLEPEYCRHILPREVFERWADALCEAMILGLGSQRFYCPFKDCSMLLIDDGDQTVKESECPNCRRLFCAQCNVPWHAEIECGEFQKLHKDEREREDIMVLKLAKNQRWARCPKCRTLVEKISGCRYIFCRCRTAFCYDCGTTSVDNTHYCYNCKR